MKRSISNSTKMKPISGFHLMKFHALLSILILHSCFARIGIQGIKEIHENPIDGDKTVFVNFEGPLGLLDAYCSSQNGYIYNKRFYSAEIDRSYSLKEGDAPSNYIFTRAPAKDKVYKDLSSKSDTNEYLKVYHTLLIKMFPSVDGDLSIEAGRLDMITNFLRAEHVKKDAKYILAALLLLSEGIDVQISVDGSEKKKSLVIKSKKCEGKILVDVDMHIININPCVEEQRSSIYQSETAKIVNFYKKYRDSPLLKEGGEFAIPTSIDGFNSGKFLNNSGLLIQTYIYEFFDNIKDYRSFVSAVHELLIDQISESDNLKEATQKTNVFSKLFRKKYSLFDERKKYITQFYNFVKDMQEIILFPFYNSSQLPSYTRVPPYKLDKSGFETNQSLYYSNCVETALLGLFCCLAYNLETKRYQTSHMGEEISKELREFFEKYPKPTETTDFEMHLQWCKVVACLDSKKVLYIRTGNELYSGIINMFLVIAEITGKKTDILDLVEYMKNANIQEDPNCIHTNSIQFRMQEILKSLSQNKSLEVSCKNIKREGRVNFHQDLFANISITFTYGETITGIALGVTKGHTKLTLLPSTSSKYIDMKKKSIQLAKSYYLINPYTMCVIDQYISSEVLKLEIGSQAALYFITTALNKVALNPHNNPSQIFIYGKIDSTISKEVVILSFFFETLKKDLSPSTPLVRITANIFCSIPLDDSDTQKIMIPMVFYYSNWQEYYPKLTYTPPKHLKESDLHPSALTSPYKHILSTNSVPRIVKYLRNYLQTPIGDRNIHYLLFRGEMLKKLFNLIVDNHKISSFAEIQSILEETKQPTDADALNSVYIGWFIYACIDSTRTPEIIKTTYSFIDFDNLHYTREKELEKYYTHLDTAINVLVEEKSILCTENNSESIQKYNNLLRYFRIVEKRSGLYERLVEKVAGFITWVASFLR
ncbi:hypothetical protein NEAUS07_1905 [Nematocida ausubeli]|nr:hypothetical protein NEAUS07_1905 [Nematocida ausubeli]